VAKSPNYDSEVIHTKQIQKEAHTPTDNAAEYVMLSKMDEPAPFSDTLDAWNNWHSEYIHRDDFFRTYEGICFANRMGVSLNVELTVCWEASGCSEEDVYELMASEIYKDVVSSDTAFRLFMDRYKKFVRYRNGTPYYWAVFENGPHVGLHSHIGLHIPDSWSGYFRRWLKRTLVNHNGEPMTYSVHIHKERHITGQWQWFRYAFKGTDPTLKESEQLENGPGATFNSLAGIRQYCGGGVPFKRVRISRSMLGQAQRDANYIPPPFTKLNVSKRYSDSEYREGNSERIRAEMNKYLGPLDTL